MGRRRIVAAAFMLVVVSCTDADPEGASTTSESASPGSSAPSQPVDSGRLAILDSSGDVVVVAPDGSGRQAITDDAGEAAVYTQPIWSPDATTLAWGQVTEDGFAVGIHAPGTGEPATFATSNLPFYMFWSPNGQSLGVLHNGTTGVEFRIVDVAGGAGETLDEATPFYFSWSPEGDRVVTHAGATRAETIRPDGERSQLEPTAATYLAPQWTPNGVFHVVDDQLILEADDGDRAPVAEVSGLTMFVSNERGTKVALQVVGDGSGITAAAEEFPTVVTGAVVVVDVESGETDVISNDLALGFFWSPDGQSLLLLTTSETRVVPEVWTPDGQTGYEPYFPPPTMLQDTFPFFPQYAQSVSFWSPDGSAFAYAGEVDGETGIWIQDLSEEAPTRVSDGVWVAWSPARR